MAKLPTVSSPIPRDLRAFLDRVREAFDSDSIDAAVTNRQLVAAGIASYSGNSLDKLEADTFTTPAAPEGVATSSALANIILTWSKPAYRGHSYAEIWASDGLNASIGDAVLVGMSPGTFFSHSLGAGGSRTYWVRFINYNGLAGPYHATDGTNGQTSQSPDYLMSLLTEAYGTNSESPFFQLDQATTIDGVSIPAGTYMKTAFVVDGSITRAKIGDAAIDNAKIANLDAGKINTGFLAATRIETGSLDAKIANLGAAVITSGTIDAARIGDASITSAKIDTASITNLSSLAVDAGTLTAGVLKSSDNKFVIDLNNKTISIET